MNREDTAKAAHAEEALSDPGIGAALLAVLVMIVSTLILAFLIYIVMVAIVPTEPRQVQKISAVEQPLPHAQSTKRIEN